MPAPLAHASIIVTASEESYATYFSNLTTNSDEIIDLKDHPNQTKTSSGIYIDDIRSLQETVRTAKRRTRTIVILDDAAKLTTQAQNALLKLLEEPRENLFFILKTASPTKLLQTVRSRCQIVSLVSESVVVDLPADTKARILFMAGKSTSEQQKLASDSRYFEHRSKLFMQAKEFVGGDPYTRLVIIKQVSDKRDTALEFIEVTLRMYNSLIVRGFSARLRDETALLLEIDQAIRANANSKLQLLRAVV